MTPLAEDRLRHAIEELADAVIAAVRETEPADRPERLLGVDQAANLLGIGRSLIYKEIAAGRLRSLRVGRRRLIASSALAAYSGGAPPGTT